MWAAAGKDSGVPSFAMQCTGGSRLSHIGRVHCRIGEIRSGNEPSVFQSSFYSRVGGVICGIFSNRGSSIVITIGNSAVYKFTAIRCVIGRGSPCNLREGFCRVYRFKISRGFHEVNITAGLVGFYGRRTGGENFSELRLSI